MSYKNIKLTLRHKPKSKSCSRFKVGIKKTNILEIIVMNYLLILGMFSRWIELSRVWRLVLLFLFIALVTKKKFARELKRFVASLWFIVPVMLFVLSGLLGDSYQYFFFNLNRIVWPLFIATSIALIVITKPNIVYEVFEKNLLFLNIVWIINIIVLMIQCTGTPLLIKSSWLQINPYYVDQCCGLFGNSGTHELSAFSIFMIMYDLYQGYYRLKGIKRSLMIGFAYLTGIIILILSTKNDNMALLFILPIFMFLFYMQKAQWTGKNIGVKIRQSLKYIVPLIVLIIIVMQIPSINNFINERVIGRVGRMLHYNYTGVLGSNVRTAALEYAFTQGKGWWLGYGVGTWPFAEGTTDELFHGFSNFGLNSMSTYIMLGGVWLYIASVFLFARYLYIVCCRQVNTKGYFFVCICVVVLFTFYTVLFNSLQTMLWLMMTFITFGFCRDNISRRSINKICLEKNNLRIEQE